MNDKDRSSGPGNRDTKSGGNTANGEAETPDAEACDALRPTVPMLTPEQVVERFYGKPLSQIRQLRTLEEIRDERT